MTKQEALKLREAIEKSSVSLDDKTATTAAAMFPKLKEDGSLVKAGTRINWNGIVKKAAVDLWDTKENNPANAPTLWADLMYHDGVRIIPEVITAATAFNKGEEGYWKGKAYISLLDSNVWTPDTYPTGWGVKA